MGLGVSDGEGRSHGAQDQARDRVHDRDDDPELAGREGRPGASEALISLRLHAGAHQGRAADDSAGEGAQRAPGRRRDTKGGAAGGPMTGLSAGGQKQRPALEFKEGLCCILRMARLCGFAPMRACYAFIVHAFTAKSANSSCLSSICCTPHVEYFDKEDVRLNGDTL